jgi:ABC-type branched-subunit amino acid transport system ATPase component
MRAWTAGGLPGLGKEPGEGTLQMIEARRLSKHYGGKAAVDDLSFTVRPGKVTGFLGPNGAGKTTTMRMIQGLRAAAVNLMLAEACGPGEFAQRRGAHAAVSAATAMASEEGWK